MTIIPDGYKLRRSFLTHDAVVKCFNGTKFEILDQDIGGTYKIKLVNADPSVYYSRFNATDSNGMMWMIAFKHEIFAEKFSLKRTVNKLFRKYFRK